MRQIRRGTCWILKNAHAPLSQKPVQKRFPPQNGVAFLRKALSQKKFRVREKIPVSALVPSTYAASLPGEAARGRDGGR
jgi:hypothetical protein